MRIFILLLLSFAVNAQTFHVATNGNDNNPGTTAQPFKTIQKAASVAPSGGTVIIKAGTYRETIIPTNNQVTFTADGAVIVSGLNQVTTPWTVHNGQIYKTSVTLPVNGFSSSLTSNTTLLANQVFKDGVMMFQARWPDIQTLDDLIDRGVPTSSGPNSKFRHHSQTSGGIGRTQTTDNGLPAGNFTGASIWVTGWFISETKTIKSHSGKTIGYDQLNENGKFQKWYYIVNDLELLSTAKEWHYENGTLYFWQPNGGLPTGVEYKARNWGFDLRGKSGTKIIGIQFIGCEPATGDAGTNNTLIDGIRAQYNNHAFVTSPSDWNYFNAKQTGIKLLGSNNTIRNSEFKYVSSQVIWATSGTVVENNLCSDIGWEGNYGAFVGFWGTSSDRTTITRNTAYRLGRSAVDFGHGMHKNIDISYNHFHTFSMVTSDVGATYGCCGVQLHGTRIHHNVIHDNMVKDGWKIAANFDGIHVNIYHDQGAGPVTIDHNVTWNGAVADYYSEIKNGVINNLYNNTFATVSSTGAREAYFCPHDTPSDVQRNNIYRHSVNINWKYATNNTNASQPGDVSNSVFATTDPQFIGTGTNGLQYQLKPTSPALNIGAVIAGITDGSQGAPDAGAFEYGVAPWTAGYKSVITPIPPDPIPPDTLDPEPPKPPAVLKDTVFDVTVLEGYQFKGVNVHYPVVTTKVEAESGQLTGATVGGANGYKVCCIKAGAVLKYGSRTSTGKIKIRYGRADSGQATGTIKVGGKSQSITFDNTGGWDTMKEQEFNVPAGTGEIEFNFQTPGTADLDYIIF